MVEMNVCNFIKVQFGAGLTFNPLSAQQNVLLKCLSSNFYLYAPV